MKRTLLITTALAVHWAAAAITFDFESNTLPSAFSGAGSVVGTQDYPATFGEYFLRNDTGGFEAGGLGIAGTPTVLTLNNLPTHTGFTLVFNLAVINSWDGDTEIGGTVPVDRFNIVLNGSPHSLTFDNFDMQDQSVKATTFSSEMFQDGSEQWPDSAWTLSTIGAHTADTLEIQWFADGSGWQGGADESFAIDNVRIELTGTNPTVPEIGSSACLLGLALTSLAAFRRKN